MLISLNLSSNISSHMKNSSHWISPPLLWKNYMVSKKHILEGFRINYTYIYSIYIESFDMLNIHS